MRTLGRIILLVVGGCMIGLAIPGVISDFKALTVNGWDFKYMFDHMELVSSFLSGCINISFGITAVFAALKGRSSFGLLTTTIVVIAPVIWSFYTNYQAGTLDTMKMIQSVSGFILPVGYFLGFLFILIGRRKQN